MSHSSIFHPAHPLPIPRSPRYPSAPLPHPFSTLLSTPTTLFPSPLSSPSPPPPSFPSLAPIDVLALAAKNLASTPPSPTPPPPHPTPKRRRRPPPPNPWILASKSTPPANIPALHLIPAEIHHAVRAETLRLSRDRQRRRALDTLRLLLGQQSDVVAGVRGDDDGESSIEGRAARCGDAYRVLFIFADSADGSCVLRGAALYIEAFLRAYAARLLWRLEEGHMSAGELVLQAEEVVDDMWLLVGAVRDVERAGGGASAVLDALYRLAYRHSADQVLYKLFLGAFVPYLRLVWDWVFAASCVRDGHADFFATVLGSDVGGSEELRTCAEVGGSPTSAALYPSFLSPQIALKILRAGRARALLAKVQPRHPLVNVQPPQFQNCFAGGSVSVEDMMAMFMEMDQFIETLRPISAGVDAACASGDANNAGDGTGHCVVGENIDTKPSDVLHEDGATGCVSLTEKLGASSGHTTADTADLIVGRTIGVEGKDDVAAASYADAESGTESVTDTFVNAVTKDCDDVEGCGNSSLTAFDENCAGSPIGLDADADNDVSISDVGLESVVSVIPHVSTGVVSGDDDGMDNFSTEDGSDLPPAAAVLCGAVDGFSSASVELSANVRQGRESNFSGCRSCSADAALDPVTVQYSQSVDGIVSGCGVSEDVAGNGDSAGQVAGDETSVCLGMLASVDSTLDADPLSVAAPGVFILPEGVANVSCLGSEVSSKIRAIPSATHALSGDFWCGSVVTAAEDEPDETVSTAACFDLRWPPLAQLFEKILLKPLDLVDSPVQTAVLRHFTEMLGIHAHLSSLWKYALLGAGDFADVLVDRIDTASEHFKADEQFFLDRQASSAQHFSRLSSMASSIDSRLDKRMAECLASALVTCGADSDPLTERLGLSLEDESSAFMKSADRAGSDDDYESHSNSLWSRRVLVSYRTSFPLSFVISPSTLDRYSLFLNFSLRVRRADHALRRLFLVTRRQSSLRVHSAFAGTQLLDDGELCTLIWRFCWEASHFVGIIGGHASAQVIGGAAFLHTGGEVHDDIWALRDAVHGRLDAGARRTLLAKRQAHVLRGVERALGIVVAVERIVNENVESGRVNTPEEVDEVRRVLRKSCGKLGQRIRFLVDVLQGLVYRGNAVGIEWFEELLTRLDYNNFYAR